MKIQELREQRNMTQSQLGSAMGVTQNAISQWESETSLPKTRQLRLLASVLGCTISDLFQPLAEEAC